MPGQTPQGQEPQQSIYMPGDASGGGGAGGAYVFTDLDHLDRVIGRWRSIRDDIHTDNQMVSEVLRVINPPAEDNPSVTQARAASESLASGRAHNQAMVDYANGFIEKLEATRAAYAATEDNTTEAMRNVDPYQ